MAEEDILFGKNRHLFGGIEPSNMREFKVTYVNQHAKITATLPNDTVIDGQTICTVAGAIIRKKSTGFPVDEFDGTLVANITSSQTITDNDILSISDVCYYAAFPYSTQGVYNRNKANRFAFSFLDEHYYFGYDLTLAESNPSNRVTYPNEVANKDFTPAYMDYTTGKFNYGGWSVIRHPGRGFMPKPCILAFGDTPSIIQYLNYTDYSCYTDNWAYNPGSSGSTSLYSGSKVGTPSSGGNAMMEWPKIYISRRIENGVYKFRCSDVKIDSTYDCICNYDKNGKEIDNFYTSIYTGVEEINSSYRGKMRSISGYKSKTSDYWKSYINYSKANGTDWHTETFVDRLLIQDLLVMMAKTTDCQTAYGTGSSTALTNGTMDDKGMFWGSNTGNNGVKVFGMENWWGSFNRLMMGLIMNDKGEIRYKLKRGIDDYDDSGEILSDKFSTYNYLYTLQSSIETSLNNGYISKYRTITNSKYGVIPFPTECNGSSTTYETDYACFKPVYYRSGAVYLALVGGNGSSYESGPFYLNMNPGGAMGVDAVKFVTAISCKPTKVVHPV